MSRQIGIASVLKLVANPVKGPFTSFCFNLLTEPGEHTPKESDVIEHQNHANARPIVRTLQYQSDFEIGLIPIWHIFNSDLFSIHKYTMKPQSR